MAGKKWCEFCRINISYTKKDIEAHEATRLHLQNKQKQIKFERIKIQKQKKQATQHQPILSTANIPKAKKGSELQKQVEQYKDSVIHQGKSAIHRLIAERTQGLYGAPIQFPDKEDLVLAQNYQQKHRSEDGDESDDQQNFEMWKVDICESTGDPCFINKITKAILYEPPKGYVLSQSQKQQWEYLQEVCKQKVQFDPDKQVIISQWEQVPDQQNYFTVNKVQQNEQEEQQPIKNESINKIEVNQKVLQKYLQKKQENTDKIKNSERISQNSLGRIVQNDLMHFQQTSNLQNFRNVKQKTQALKKLVQYGIQIRTARPSDQLLQQETPSSFKGFKARKKVKTIPVDDDLI